MSMSEQTLKAILKAHIASAEGSAANSTLSEDRTKALEYYQGKPFGNEVDGRSKIVSRDVADTVEWMMPSILEIFTAGDDVVRFDPVGPEDEEQAKQATEFCNYVFQKQNDGFQILYDIIKDALLQKTGIGKVWWEDKEHQTVRRFRGLTRDEYDKLLQDESLEIDEETEREEEILMPDQTGQLMPQMVTVYDCRFIHTEQKQQVRVESIPPEEFLFSRRAVKLEDEAGHMIVPFVAHRVKKSVSDLVQEGFSYKELMDIPSAEEGEFNQERIERFDDQDEEDVELDKSMRSIWVHECYLRVDADGDGIAETRKVIVGGNGHTILSNEECDEQPFIVITPVPMPHALVGDSVADQVKDIQELKSTIWRQLLDNIYNVNNTRNAVSNKVDLDSLLNNAVGGTVIIDTDQGDIGGHIQPMQTPSIANHIFPMLEYADQVKESRAGVSRLNQGLNPDALNDTAAGMNMLMTASQRRMMLIARIFAQTGIRDMFKKILRLSVKYQDKPLMIRLRNQFVEVDPASWNAQMDVTINVGLGYGSREQQLVARRQILDIQLQGIQMQGGLNGPIFKANHVSHAIQKFIEAAGEQQPDAYVSDVSPEQADEIASQPPAPDPNAQKMQMEMQAKQAEMQMKQQGMQAELQMKSQTQQQDAQIKQLEQQNKRAELEMKAKADEQAAMLDAQKAEVQIQMEREERAANLRMAQAEHELKLRMMQEEAALKREIAMMQAQTSAQVAAYSAQQKAEADHEKAQPKESKSEMPNITIHTGSKKRKVKVERDEEGGIVGAMVEDDD